MCADGGSAPPTRAEWARFALLQHGGLLLCAAGIALLVAGYDAGWMHQTSLCLITLAFCLAGLAMHETRPVNVSAQP